VQYIHSSAYILAVILLFAILSCLEVIAENETLKKSLALLALYIACHFFVCGYIFKYLFIMF